MARDNSRFEPIDIGEVTVIRTTEKAILIQSAAGKEKWIPKSQICQGSEIDGDSATDETGTLLLPRWLVDEENLG